MRGYLEPELTDYYKVDRPLSDIDLSDKSLLAQTAVELSLMYGWRMGDLTNLRHFHSLEHLHILNDKPFDWSAVAEVPTLKSFGSNVDSTVRVDFSNLTCLRSVSVKWHQNIQSLTTLPDIVDLYIGFSKINTEEILPHFPNLVCLSMKGTTPNTLDPLSHLSQLREFWFAHVRKQAFSLEPLGYCKSLERVILNYPGTERLSFAKELPNLKVLMVENFSIPSLNDLAYQPSIEEFRLTGNSIVEDGDIAVILTLPNLQEGFVRMRRHYNLKGGVFERVNGKLIAKKLEIPKIVIPPENIVKISDAERARISAIADSIQAQKRLEKEKRQK